MSQVTQITIDNVAFGTFRSNLNDTLNALNSMHSGTSRPASATTGTIWLDTTNAGSNSLTIKFFDGTDDITVADVDTSANTINFIDSTVTTELLSDLSPQLGGMLDVNGNAIGNGTEELIKFSETASAVNEITVTNSATGNAPEISATGDDTDIDLKLTPKGSGNLNLDGLIFPNADGTTGQFLKTDGSGNLSFDTASGGENTPAFFAYKGSGTNQTIANDTYVKVEFNTESFDTDSNFASNRFTPTTAGKYYIFANIALDAGSSNFEYGFIAIYKNGSVYAVTNNQQTNNLANHINIPITIIDEANGSTDYYEIYARCADSSGSPVINAGVTEKRCTFGAYKLIGA
jgi:hypothetical protein